MEKKYGKNGRLLNAKGVEITPAKPRRERGHPQSERCFSIKSNPSAFIESGIACYVPLEDYRKLEQKYLLSLKRYKRNQNEKA